MAIKALDLMEPEETVGNLWHDYASRVGAPIQHPDGRVALVDIRPSVTLLFRALGGAAGVELSEAALTVSPHRLSLKRKLGTAQERQYLPIFDGERLRLPPEITTFAAPAMNRTLYLWLAALSACIHVHPGPADPLQNDIATLAMIRAGCDKALLVSPGLREFYQQACIELHAQRHRPLLPKWEAGLESVICHFLGADRPSSAATDAIFQAIDSPDARSKLTAPMGYLPMAPVPLWLSIDKARSKAPTPREDEENAQVAAITAGKTRKTASREDREQANRNDSFIMHRFESIFSWVESMNLNRSIDDDDNEGAQKAADDQDHIALSQHSRKLASKLRLHLDLSPEDAAHERLAGKFTYPEWDHRSHSYLPNHCRVLEAEANANSPHALVPDPRRLRDVRRQFEALRPRRILRPRQIEGSELDLDALISAQVELKATGSASDRIYQSLRQIDRDLSVAFLLDTSRSTEAAVGDSSVIDISREALAALAGGIDASGDRLGIWGFSSLKRDRVFLNRCKSFDAPMSDDVTARICGLQPSHYTRLGTAIRHTTAMLEQEQSSRKLLLVLTDGKPNDLDHYEGIHGIEDSHMAVREARRAGHTVHGIIIDQDGQDWFARIFGRGGFSLLPDPERLTRALPDIYRSLVQES